MPLRRAFGTHIVETALERGWSELENGALVQAAESMGFDLFVTTDKNIRYQQNLTGGRVAIVVLWTTSWPDIKPHAAAIATVAVALQPGEFRELDPPA